MFSLIVESLPSEIVNLFLNIVSKSPKDVLPLVDYDWFDRKLLFIKVMKGQRDAEPRVEYINADDTVTGGNAA
jgi:hypothetical protein